jgi:hypothetical protein
VVVLTHTVLWRPYISLATVLLLKPLILGCAPLGLNVKLLAVAAVGLPQLALVKLVERRGAAVAATQNLLLPTLPD